MPNSLCIISVKELQNLMSKIITFFEFKYHENMIIEMHENKKSDEYLASLEISEKLDIEELKYRLSSNEVHFLDCDYTNSFELKKKREQIWDLPNLTIYVDKLGNISEKSLADLNDYEYLEYTEGIKTIPDLLRKLLESPIKIDYSNLKKIIIDRKINYELRYRFLELTILAMLYSKNSMPNNSYVRIKNFVRMFNKEYNLNLNINKIDEIMNIDYQNLNYYSKIKTKQRIKNYSNNLKKCN